MYRNYNQLGEEKLNGNDYSIISVQNRNHRFDIIKKNRIVCIMVQANWCKPCKIIEPDYAYLAKEYNASQICLCLKENFDNGIKSDYPEIKVVPTFLIFNKGHLVSAIEGTDLNKVRSKIDSLMEDANNQPQTFQSAPLGYAQNGNEPLYRQNYGQHPHPDMYPSFQH